MSNSPLVTYTKISPNKTSPRNHIIDTITIHCTAGNKNGTAKSVANLSNFVNYNAKNGSSCNYAVGGDGSIALIVDEGDRSWCTSSRSNDNRAITIEVSSTKDAPNSVTDEAYSALIELVADICKRNNIKELKWKADKNLIGQTDKQNMTVHRWFANKACPGNYLYERHADIAAKVNAKLNQEDDEDMTQEKFNELMNEYLKEVALQPVTWEQDSMLWAQQNGLIVGDATGNLMAKKDTTRGELVTVLKRFYEKITKEFVRK